MVHFRREKYVPRGGPDGGDGGKGGDVIFEVTKHVNTLFQFRNNRLYAADDGDKGGPNNRFGKSGEDLIIKVPAGTMVYDSKSGNLIGDMVKEGQTLVVCAGGPGWPWQHTFQKLQKQSASYCRKRRACHRTHIAP